ncbi:MAG TPA: hypothetical protein VJR29_03790 [bacterium]|nr:hypothetical protein [bacterium]
MRKSNIIYLIWAVVTIGAIYAIIQYGNRLQAPAALPKQWALQVSPHCPIFAKADPAMSIKQSGETLEVLILQVPQLNLHGKLKRDGSFSFAGETRGLSSLGCRRGKLLWVGKAGRDSIEGAFQVQGEHCQVCPQPIQVSGRPR